jgi:K+-transporting ATPase ATPase C chain
MSAHLRGLAVLFVMTVLLCCVVYPLALWGFGRAFFREQAAGSLIDEKGELTTDASKARGSRLIGQPFSGAVYFQPRPSAAGNGYDASQSGGSNLAASNVKLRDRVARLLGTTAVLKKKSPEDRERRPVGPEIEKWFAERTNPQKDFKPGEKIRPGETDAVTLWAKEFPTLASNWVTADAANTDYVKNWKGDDLVARWRAKTGAKPDAKPAPEDLAEFFFPSFARTNPGKWPVAKEKQTADGKTEVDENGKPLKEIKLVSEDDDLRAAFFELWYQRTKPELEPVPADMVLASGSGLDPHITLRNANYQAPGVIEERAKARVKDAHPKIAPEELEAKAKKIEPAVEKLVHDLIGKHSFTPMWGLAAGDPLVNVLELNLALDAAMKTLTVQ